MKRLMLDNLSLRKKLWSGTFIFVLAVVAVLAVNNQRRTSTNASIMIDQELPELRAELALRNLVQNEIATLGLYLLSDNAEYLSDHESNEHQIEDTIVALRKMFETSGDPRQLETLTELHATWKAIEDVEGRLIKLAELPLQRIPALGAAQRDMAPINAEAIGSIRGVIATLDLSGETPEHLARYFNRFVNRIKGVVDLVVMASTSLAGESTRMNEATEISQTHASRQQADVEEIAVTITQMEGSALQVKEKAEAAAAAASTANDHARQGQRAVQAVTGVIESMVHEVGVVSGIIDQLETDSSQIGVVLSVIRTISEQTNPLALNAAIEAARAGENGRGFAVVADEVRKLSKKIHAETDHIESIIQTLQKNTQSAVAAISRGDQQADEVASKTEHANAALESIAGSVASITELNTSIAEHTGMQSAAVVDVHHKIDSIREIAKDAAVTAQTASLSSKKFTLMPGQLQDLVKQFLLDDKELTGTARAVPATENTQAPAVKTQVADAVDDGDVVLF